MKVKKVRAAINLKGDERLLFRATPNYNNDDLTFIPQSPIYLFDKVAGDKYKARENLAVDHLYFSLHKDKENKGADTITFREKTNGKLSDKRKYATKAIINQNLVPLFIKFCENLDDPNYDFKVRSREALASFGNISEKTSFSYGVFVCHTNTIIPIFKLVNPHFGVEIFKFSYFKLVILYSYSFVPPPNLGRSISFMLDDTKLGTNIDSEMCRPFLEGLDITGMGSFYLANLILLYSEAVERFKLKGKLRKPWHLFSAFDPHLEGKEKFDKKLL